MENYNVVNKGIITLNDKVMVSDPCYGLNTWCQGVLENVLPGKYECKVGFADEGEWGTRVADIEVIHNDYLKEFLDYNDEDFDVGVDSGTAGVFDYEYYKKYHKDRSERDHVNSDWYERTGDITFVTDIQCFDANTIDGLGFVSSSGYGDGCYTCWTARDDEGKIVAIRVEFIIEEDEEEL